MIAEEVSILSPAFFRFHKAKLGQVSKRTNLKYSIDPWGPLTCRLALATTTTAAPLRTAVQYGPFLDM